MAMADGSVHFVANSIDLTIFRQRGIKDDGLPVGAQPGD
jgi:hypothetical protein